VASRGSPHTACLTVVFDLVVQQVFQLLQSAGYRIAKNGNVPMMAKAVALKHEKSSGSDRSCKREIDLNAELQSAVQHHKAGRLEQADRYYCRVLEIMHDNPDAMHLRGVVALQQGRNDDAADLIQRAIQLDPTCSIFYNNLGNVYKKMGQPQAAISCYRRALRLNPHYFEAYYDLANVLQDLKRTKEAVSCYRQALAINPEFAVALNNLGVALNELERKEDALACYRKAIEINPDYLDAYNNLASLLEGQNRLDQAREAVDKALRIDPRSYFAILNFAQLEFRQGNFKEAADLLEELIRVRPSEEFASRTYTLLGMVYDKLGLYRKAFEAFRKGNARESVLYHARCCEEGRQKDLAWINRLPQYFDSNSVSGWNREPSVDDYPQPIFLVGFPRSGTTLLEQILEAHPKIISMEEKPVLENIIRIVLPGKGENDDLSSISTHVMTEFRHRYWKLAQTFIGENFSEKIVLDKLPLNIIYLGFINRFFPDAKVIVALRHPLDTVLSNFIQRYKLNKRMANFLDIESSAQFYIAVMSLYRHFRKVLSMDYTEVRYEDIVLEFESEVRRLLSFLELPWDDNVLRFDVFARSRNINTPSYSQVIKPIYRDSISRWQRYEKQLAPIIPRMSYFIRSFGYAS
jgi:tetratricopeptide (TPR) repeat protein